MTFAINIDPDNNIDQYAHQSPSILYSEKFRGVRFVSKNTDANRNYVVDFHINQLSVLAIVTGQSKGYLVPGADIYQIGNEPDKTTMTADDYYWNWWKIYRDSYPAFTMYMAGLASGGQNAVNYAQRVLELCTANGTRKPDAIAIHPYGKTSVEAAGDFDLMWNMAGIPVTATEWHQTAASGDMWNFVCMLNNPDDGRSTVWNSFFCYSDSMVSPFGLRSTPSGAPKDDYYSLLSAPCIP